MREGAAAGTRVLRFAVVPTSLGFVSVAAGTQGVCAIELGDVREDLIASLGRRFPEASLVEDAEALAEFTSSVCELVEDPTREVSICLDEGGTPFQRAVWDVLRAIPVGETRTYAQVAEAVGRPAASRAVASACASNRLAVVIPCHRVVRADGSLSGYRWGVERKRALLERETSRGDR